MVRPFANALSAATCAALLAGCASNASSLPSAAGPAPLAAAVRRDSGPFPPACTVPQVKSGANVTMLAAYGNVSRGGSFHLAQPTTWMQVEWLSTPPPAKRHRVAPHSTKGIRTYFGTYTVSDGTQGCLYVTVRVDGGIIVARDRAAVTGDPRIPDTGATLPVNSGEVSTMDLSIAKNGTGSGTFELAPWGGGKALFTGTITLSGYVDSN
ncbi:MAG: hypothetical protein JO199_02410 [Candidatus Eremiobacteraeota bacterium]|nr:hypothetical protein [Candidatus Eremiobacteraeota bacterium]